MHQSHMHTEHLSSSSISESYCFCQVYYAHHNSQQTGIVQHLNDLADALQLLRRNVQPVIEGERQLGAHILAGNLLNVDEWLQQNLKNITENMWW